MNPIEWLKMLPTSVQVAVAGILLGITAVYAHETRYMTIDQFTKSYILDLKSIIRDLEKELREEDLTPRERELIEDEIDSLIDELCYENPKDRLCHELEQ